LLRYHSKSDEKDFRCLLAYGMTKSISISLSTRRI